MTTSDLIALGSLIVAFIALIYSFFTDRKTRKLDAILKEKELSKTEKEEQDAKKADIEVEQVEAQRKSTPSLRFYNRGNAEARNVTFEITSDPEGEICLRMSNDYLPYPKLLPYQAFEIHYYDSSDKPHHTVVIRWDDDYANGRVKEMVIDM